MIAALLLLIAQPTLTVRVETPTRPSGLSPGRRLPPRKPRVQGRSWAVRAVLTFHF
ncbi:MAG: hypothetical protein ACRYFW_04180 [Janthinobacterium lividum]